MESPVLIKVGGHEISNPAFLGEFASVVASIQRPVIIVHGGGKEISTLQQKLGIEPQYLDGVRITNAASLSLVEMVLCGTVNKRLVRYLIAAGIDAHGLSGVDRGLIRAEKMGHASVDMGFTGTVTSVRGDVLQAMLRDEVMPVIAPICLGHDSAYNVNADHVAGAVAAAVGATRVVFLTNVAGVLLNDVVIPRLAAEEARIYIHDGTIRGGMIPKVETALHTLNGGVSEAVITNLNGLKTESGTVLVA